MDSERILDFNGVGKLYKVDILYFASQPTCECIPNIKDLGVTKIINLRNKEEMDFCEERDTCRNLGIEYIEAPLIKEGKFNFDTVSYLNNLLKENKDPVFIHCGSANRVASWAITFLVESRGMEFEEAISLAENSGLMSYNLVEEAQRYLDSKLHK